MPARSTMTKGPLARGSAAWRASAHSSLPVPVSPWMSTSASPGASRSSSVNTSRIRRLLPTSAAEAGARGRRQMTRSRESSGTIFSSVVPSLRTAPGRTSSSREAHALAERAVARAQIDGPRPAPRAPPASGAGATRPCHSGRCRTSGDLPSTYEPGGSGWLCPASAPDSTSSFSRSGPARTLITEAVGSPSSRSSSPGACATARQATQPGVLSPVTT